MDYGQNNLFLPWRHGLQESAVHPIGMANLRKIVHINGFCYEPELKTPKSNADFNSIMLLKNNLWTSLLQSHDISSRALINRHNVNNKTYRFAAYRQFCWFVHTNLGKGVRRVVRRNSPVVMEHMLDIKMEMRKIKQNFLGLVNIFFGLLYIF